jgi:hypothetical protein
LAVIRAILDARERPEADRLCHVGKEYQEKAPRLAEWQEVNGAGVAGDLLDACRPPATTADLETEGAAQRGDRASDSSAGPVPERGFGLAASRGTIPGFSSPHSRTAA